ncbi:GNAT family N-acetyltransferase [Paracoccus benzoatiresistens]|uniref:GNAT family N-acetyltransferase n=1 Tax=Paracoccus benzoatiresistens TaxID=2997341 RepID=A0ABT4J2J1_9RHOB|nr:GNAT family N-acetyltransferase [Paracoccus sp. EF6]MCZ0961306.1 GNAT family N-acetyltransferase [Paracoccus sp. EF6]
MTPPPPDLSFVPVTAADLPLLARWMDQPHWREWWSADVETELGYIRDIIEGRDTTRAFLFHLDGEPTGYIQVWRITDARVEPWLSDASWVMDLPDDAVGVDLSIGPPDQVSKGIGSWVLARFVAMLRAEGHRSIVIDPDRSNHRAIRAYRKAGFREIADLSGRTGDCLLMRHEEPEDGRPASEQSAGRHVGPDT